MVAPVSNPPFAGGRASLEIQLVFGESTVTESFSTCPLKLLVPRSRGSSVWAFLSSFGGGLVAGDQTSLDLHLGAGTRCFLGTQASAKIYRNPARLPCGHVTKAGVDEGALLVFAPDPVQAFAHSAYSQRQEFRLAQDASLVLVDWFTSGRAARGERWQFDSFQTRNEVFVEGERVFLDSLRLDPEDGPLTSAHRLGRFNCFATVLLLGPAVSALAQSILADVRQRPVTRATTLLCAASPVRDGAVLRVAGEATERVGHEWRRFLTPLKEQLGDDPWSRKW